jgi:hypothetical protein
MTLISESAGCCDGAQRETLGNELFRQDQTALQVISMGSDPEGNQKQSQKVVLAQVCLLTKLVGADRIGTIRVNILTRPHERWHPLRSGNTIGFA